jgi:hypothetical protein
MKINVWVLMWILGVVPGMAFAGTACSTPTVVVADGRITDFDFVGPTFDNFYQFFGVQGRSYSVEVRQDYDDLNSDLSFTIFDPTQSACGTPMAGLTDSTAFEPALPASGSSGTRQSFIASTTGVYRIQAHNNTANGRYISVSVSDTTLITPRWSTGGGFYTSWGFTNTTSATLHGKLTIIDAGGGPNVVVAVTINPNSPAFVVTLPKAGGVNVPAGHSGSAVFVHDGPPGAVVADGYIVNDSPFIVTPVVWSAPRQATH